MLDIDNLHANFATVKSLIKSGVKIMSVVKSGAYGHCAITMSKALTAAGADCFGVANVEEAMELRLNAGIKKDVYILSGADRHGFHEIIKHRFIPVTYNMENLKLLDKAAEKAGEKVKVHLKFDTSMGRLGFFSDEAGEVFTEAKKLDHIIIDGIMSHLSSADEVDNSYSLNQLRKFDEIIGIAKRHGIDPPLKHIANSAGIINLKGSHYDMVRPGIMLYGSPPSRAMENKAPLKPVMSIMSRIIQIKEFPPGKCISYSRTFTTARKSRIAVLPIGYGDGYPRLLSNKGYVMLHGKKAPVVGNVTMDLTMIDVTDIKEAALGDEAVVLGGGITAWDIADMADTISYEIFTGISKRVKRRKA
jgi:alanine racemase